MQTDFHRGLLGAFLFARGPLRHEHQASPNDPRDDHQHTETVCDEAKQAIEMKPSHRRQQKFPIVALDLGACAAAEQHELERPRVGDIRRQVEQVLTEPPQAAGSTKWVACLEEQRAGAYGRDQQLRQTSSTDMKRPSGAKIR